MEFHEFACIIAKYFAKQLPKSEHNRRSAEVTLKEILYWFLDPNLDQDIKVLDYKAGSDMFVKIMNGNEPFAADDAEIMLLHFSTEAFQEHYDEAEFSEEKEDELVNEFSRYGIEISTFDTAEDIGRCFKTILKRIAEKKYDKRISIYNDKWHIEGNHVVHGKRRITLPPDLVPEGGPENDDEQEYLIALLEVYSSVDGVKVENLEDIGKLKPIRRAHLNLQRGFFFQALSLRRKLQEVFFDGDTDFEILKRDEFEQIAPEVTKEYSDCLEKVDTVLHIAADLDLQKARSGKVRELTGKGEKRGIVHMLINDGKIRWIFDER